MAATEEEKRRPLPDEKDLLAAYVSRGRDEQEKHQTAYRLCRS